MDYLIEVVNLKKHFFSGGLFREKKVVQAVQDVSLWIREKEALGLVGESGSGKTTLGRCILRLIEPTSGKIMYRGVEFQSLNKDEMLNMRKNMQMIFQDPYSTLNPIMNIESIIGEGIGLHNIGKGKEKSDMVSKLLSTVGLEEYHKYRYPHEFSGGQKQRIAIARALSTSPEFIVADEPVSALDVSIKAQILNLLKDLQEELGLTVLMITHDLNVIKHFCDRIAVMYLGTLVEAAESDELFSNILHPYTEILLSSVLTVDPRIERKPILPQGEIPTSMNPPPGCRFSTRCQYCKPICSEEVPPLMDIGGGHLVACHFWDSLSLQKFQYA